LYKQWSIGLPKINPFKLVIFTLLSIVYVPSFSQEANQLTPYKLMYGASYNYMLPFKGTASRELKQEGGFWRLSHKLSSAMLKIKETSEFQLKDQDIVPLRYRYNQAITLKKRRDWLDFDWETLKVTNISKKTPLSYEIIEGTFDKLTYQLQMRMQLIRGESPDTYPVADRSKLRHYVFEKVADEVLTLPSGSFDSLKMGRVREADSRRETFVWLAKDWDYLVLKIQHVEKGKSYAIELKEGEYGGQPVTGRLESTDENGEQSSE